MDAGPWSDTDTAALLRVPTASDDKYSRGVVGMRTGSVRYPGAAVLGVEAAWRAGAGMVRYLGPARAADLVLQRRPETVAADGRVQAWVIGSGTDQEDRADAEAETLRRILDGDVPVVVDAGALDLAIGARAPLIVTPHAGEHARLRASLGLDASASASDDARERAALETAAALGATVLLKGFTTIVADASGWAVRVRAATPWLATAGAGDVLAGIVGALVAGRRDADAPLGPSAAAAAWLHGQAAVVAASARGPLGGPIAALEVAEALPTVIARTVAGDLRG
ncbi:NAD(P)H-hydrate dehydratase [Microbacterium fluvii]|nr:ADP/ATP-dependent (S)-NAD(P)H-hydrate dehydratase [Microbacterium fluvii]MCU4671491.1 NAD(P)H-hydrate dehydratase [Microbacterium fluvii]